MTIAARALLCIPMHFALVGCIGANLHVVDEGRFYRSAQLDADELEEVITTHGIRTIINLRGPNAGVDWYDAEKEVALRHGVDLIDIPMSAQRLPHRRDLIRLLDAYRDAERPLLVHCKAGADRTGEASAIYTIEYMGATREEALEQLRCRYWHLPLFTPAKRYFVRLYEGRDWAYEVYDPCVQEYDYYDEERYCEQAAAAP